MDIKLLLSWFVEGASIRQGHTDTVTGHPPVPHEGLLEAQTFVMVLIIPVGGCVERIVSILYHACHHSFYEGICGCVKVEHHFVAASPTDKPNCFSVDLGEEQCH